MSLWSMSEFTFLWIMIDRLRAFNCSLDFKTSFGCSIVPSMKHL
jgi:hypothetical protein